MQGNGTRFSLLRRAERAVRGALCLSLFASLASCADAERGATTVETAAVTDSAVVATDADARTVRLARPARRVVSLVPSATETLFALGAGGQVVGRTNFDTEPAARHLPSVGGGIDPNLEALVALRPDLVVAWEERKSPGLRQRLERVGIPVLAMRTRDTADIFRNVGQLGTMVGRDTAAMRLSGSLRRELGEVSASVSGRARPSVLFVVWNDPPMTVGPATFIAQVVDIAGGRTVFPDLQQDWPEVSMEEIVRRQPDVVILPIGENRPHSVQGLRSSPGWMELRAVREGRVVEVPADLMNRPGPHLGRAAREMRDALRRATTRTH